MCDGTEKKRIRSVETEAKHGLSKSGTPAGGWPSSTTVLHQKVEHVVSPRTQKCGHVMFSPPQRFRVLELEPMADTVCVICCYFALCTHRKSEVIFPTALNCSHGTTFTIFGGG